MIQHSIFQAKLKTHNGIFFSEFEVFTDSIRTMQFTQEINPKIPSFNGYTSVRSLSDINMFVGLETDSKALMRVSHSHIGAEITDIDFQVELQEGNSLNTNFNWRGQLGEDIKSIIKTTILYFDKLNKNKTLDDVELIVQSVGEISLFLADSLVELANLKITSVFNPWTQLTSFIRGMKIGENENVKKLIDYYIGGLEFLVSYR